MLYKHWLCKDLLHLLHIKSTMFPAPFYRRLHPAATGALEGNIGSFVLCHEMLWATSLQCSKGARARHQEAHGTYQSPKCIQTRENFPMHGTSINGDTPGNSWFTCLTFKCTESQSKQCWLFVMSRRKPPLDTSMSFFLIQAILIICGFHICEFASSLKLICNPKTNANAAFTVIWSHAESKKILNLPMEHAPDWDQTRQYPTFNHLHFCFSSHTLNKYSFCSLFSTTFFFFFAFSLVISMFQMAPKHVVPEATRLWCAMWRK